MNSESGILVTPNQFEDRRAGDPKVSFEHLGGMYFLRTLETSDGVYTLPLPRSTLLMAKSSHIVRQHVQAELEVALEFRLAWDISAGRQTEEYCFTG